MHPIESSRLRAWLELVRVPNLLTVPGDPIVGFLLAGAGQDGINPARVIPCAAASLLLYSAGIISNDCFDIEEDRLDRPGRPLPSGRVRPRTALVVAVSLFALGIALATLAGMIPAVVACVLALAVVAYNAGGKRVPGWGPLNMGLCRGLSLMLGAAAFGVTGLSAHVVLAAAAGLTLYVASVTLIAAKETAGKAPGSLSRLPLAALMLLLCLCWWLALPSEVGRLYAPLCLGIAAIFQAYRGTRGLRLEDDPKKVSKAVSVLLLALIPLQGSLAAMTPELPLSVLLAVPVIVFFCAGWLARRFYAS